MDECLCGVLQWPIVRCVVCGDAVCPDCSFAYEDEDDASTEQICLDCDLELTASEEDDDNG